MNRKIVPLAALSLSVVLSLSCLTHLRRAKQHYAEGQNHARAFRAEDAAASWKAALAEADRECRRKPSAQACMVKGLAEANLERWPEAAASFLKAFDLGFDAAQPWAADVSLLGLAVSFQELGLEGPAVRAYEKLLDKSKLRPVLAAAAQKYFDLGLSRAMVLANREKERALAGLLKTVDRLESADYACGVFHYYHSQIEGHLAGYRRSYEEAVAARGLGLPSEKIFRDNDIQIVFCYDKLKDILAAGEWADFAASHAGWTKRWGWRDARTPGWKRDQPKE